jgi:hypothetical protein
MYDVWYWHFSDLTGRADDVRSSGLGADRFHQSANALNAHHPFHGVGKDVSAISVLSV